jgi:hypothetical protein
VNQEQLVKFQKADWPSLQQELRKYAEKKVAARKWRSGAFLPKGLEAPDIACMAIVKTLNGIIGVDDGSGRRAWNEEKNPTLLEHLLDAVDSEVSNLVRSTEHKKHNYSAKLSADDAAAKFEEEVDSTTESAPPEDRAEAHGASAGDGNANAFEQFRDKLYAALEKDEEATLLLMAYDDLSKSGEPVKPQEAADYLKMQIADVRNIVKRVRRAAEKVWEASGEKSHA